MRKSTQLFFALALGAAVAACERNPNDRPDTAAGTAGAPAPDARGTAGRESGDQRLIREIAAANVAEIELGRLAQQKASSPEVTRFAEMMVRDHTKSLDNFKRAVSQTTPSVQLPASLEDKHQQLRDRLSPLSGAEFDREYMKAMVEGHEGMVDKLEQLSRDGSGELKNFASTALPTTREHLKQARQINQKLT